MQNPPDHPEHSNILAISGGNDPFALFAPIVIRRLQREQPFLDNTQVFTGTSAGALVALALASEEDPLVGIDKAFRLINQYARMRMRWLAQLGKDLSRIFWDPFDMIRATTMTLQYMFTTLYPNDQLDKIVEDEFGNMTFRDLAERKRFVAIPSFRLDGIDEFLGGPTWRPRVFQNMYDKGDNMNYSLHDVAMAALGDPIAFPIHKAHGSFKGNYVDAYMYASNPSLVALTYLLRSLSRDHTRDNMKPAKYYASILSIGACWPPNYYLNVDDSGNWGAFQWMVGNRAPLLKVLASSSTVSTQVQAQTLLQHRYLHIDQKITDVPPAYYELDSCLRQAQQLGNSAQLYMAKQFVRTPEWELPEDVSEHNTNTWLTDHRHPE